MSITDNRIKIISQPEKYIMPEEYYRIANAEHFWIKWRFETIKKVLPKNFQWERALDIGCGNGITARQIEQYYSCAISGCDVNMFALNMTLANGPMYFYDIHNRLVEFREAFSNVLLLDVLEHIDNPELFLSAVNFHLKPKGRLIINVPAFSLFYSSYDSVQGHFRRYNLSRLNSELKACGFVIEDARYWGILFTPLLLLRKFILLFFDKKKAYEIGFKPTSWLVNSFLSFLMHIESILFPEPFFGTSLMVVARKERNEDKN